jgi:alcohol/geraniol dehydrogenase (NADP+)
MRAYAQLSEKEPLVAIEVPELPLDVGEVEVEVTQCSLCHSDLHLLDGEWGPQQRPLVVGHEIVGRVQQSRHPSIGVGSVVGIGWQAGSCGICACCTQGQEHLCLQGKKRTCVGRTGGLAERVRVEGRFCFPLPESLLAQGADGIAPLLCAGLTVFSPLTRFACSKGKTIGVVGFGGLGHLAVQFAHKLGAEVVVFDPVTEKKQLATRLGANAFVTKGEALPTDACDLLLVTTHANLDVASYLKALRLHGTLCLLGVPSEPLRVPIDPLLDEQKSVTGSVIGSPKTMQEMLHFAGMHGIRAITETMGFAECNEAIAKLRKGEARMRIVLQG